MGRKSLLVIHMLYGFIVFVYPRNLPALAQKPQPDIQPFPVLSMLNEAQSAYELGNRLLNQGSYEAAITQYTHAIELNPYLTLAYTYRGLAYDKQGDYENALADFAYAIQLSPEDTVAYFNRGV